MDENEAKFWIGLILDKEINRCVDISECNYDRESVRDVRKATVFLEKLTEAREVLKI